MNDFDDDQRTVWCGNLSSKVTEELLYELFLQAAPLQKVRIPKDKDGNQLCYGFVTFKHIISVQYAIDLLNGIALFGRKINIKPRNNSGQPPTPPFVFAQQLNNLNAVNAVNALQGINFLMGMGAQMLVPDKLPDDNYGYNMRTSTPYQQRDRQYHRNDRREDERPYRRPYNNHHNNEIYNHPNYYGRRRQNRKM